VHKLFSGFEGLSQNFELHFRKSSFKHRNLLYLTRLFVACSFILFPSSEYIRDVSDCSNKLHIFNSSLKSNFFHEIAIIHVKFFVLSSMQR